MEYAQLPTHLAEWKPWREEIRRRIHAGAAASDLQSLVKAGCEEESLLFRLAAVVAWHNRKLDLRTAHLTTHQVKMAPTKLIEVADLMERLEGLFSVQVGEELAVEDLTRALRFHAEQLGRRLPVLKPGATMLGLAALCGLIGYVERMTPRPHDKEVSGLLAAVSGRDSYVATHLTQWRSKHRRDIALMGTDVVNPLLLPVPLT